MIEAETIKKLATLARIEVTTEETESLRKDIDSILAYVSEIKDVSVGVVKSGDEIKNVMREDGDPYPPGVFRDALLSAVPKRSGDYIVVKKILPQ